MRVDRQSTNMPANQSQKRGSSPIDGGSTTQGYGNSAHRRLFPVKPRQDVDMNEHRSFPRVLCRLSGKRSRSSRRTRTVFF